MLFPPFFAILLMIAPIDNVFSVEGEEETHKADAAENLLNLLDELNAKVFHKLLQFCSPKLPYFL
jgi:hypothetical protein